MMVGMEYPTNNIKSLDWGHIQQVRQSGSVLLLTLASLVSSTDLTGSTGASLLLASSCWLLLQCLSVSLIPPLWWQLLVDGMVASRKVGSHGHRAILLHPLGIQQIRLLDGVQKRTRLVVVALPKGQGFGVDRCMC